MDPQILWIALAVVAVLAIALLATSGVRARRSKHLRERFGPEYSNTVRATGSRTKAERELAMREQRVDELEIAPLSAADRDRFMAEWQKVEARFVDRPATAVVEADEIIDEVMRARGYPVSDFEHRAADLSVHYPRIVENYRAAHRIIDDKAKAPTTEDLRQAMIRMRSLFEELVRSGDVERPIRSDREVAPASDERPLDRMRRDEDVRDRDLRNRDLSDRDRAR